MRALIPDFQKQGSFNQPNSFRRKCLTATTAGAALAAAGLWSNLLLKANVPQKEIALVVDTSIYTPTMLARIRRYSGESNLLPALGYYFKTYASKLSDESHNRQLVAQIKQTPPALFITLDDLETSLVKTAFPNTPIVCTAQSHPIGTGLVSSLAESGNNLTGITYDAFHCPKVLEFLRACFGAQPVEAAVVVEPVWCHPSRLASWFAVAQELGIELRFVVINDFADLQQQPAWQSPTDFDVWVFPYSVTKVKDRVAITEYLAEQGVLSYYERFTPLIGVGALAYEDTIIDWHRAVGEVVQRVVNGEAPSSIPFRGPDAWRFAANAQALRDLDFVLPPAAMNMISRVF
jgi:ABC-type uncharacterized transport system substrate-binding protein